MFMSSQTLACEDTSLGKKIFSNTDDTDYLDSHSSKICDHLFDPCHPCSASFQRCSFAVFVSYKTLAKRSIKAGIEYL